MIELQYALVGNDFEVFSKRGDEVKKAAKVLNAEVAAYGDNGGTFSVPQKAWNAAKEKLAKAKFNLIPMS